MPYSKAHYVVALVLIATIIGFWPSYFGNLREAPFAFHFHGIIATTWIILLMIQAWSIHSRRVVFHRTLGRTSLVLFPLLTGSLVMIANVSAAGYVAGGPYYGLVGPVFGFATVPPFIAYLLLYTQALRHRRQVHLHSGYMLGTAFFIWEPAAARLLTKYFPPMEIAGPADFYKVIDAIALGIVLPLLLAIFLYFRHRKFGTPFLVVFVFLLLQITGLYLIADTQVWLQIFAWYANLPSALTVGTGIFLGACAAWFGWNRPYGRAR